MTNMTMRVDGTKLVIEVDLGQEHGRSKSGKNVTIASSGGNVAVPSRDEIKVGLNVYKSAS